MLLKMGEFSESWVDGGTGSQTTIDSWWPHHLLGPAVARV